MKKTTGMVTGTETTLNVEVGFKPDKVRIINIATRTETVFNAADTVNVNGVAVAADGVKTKAASAAHGISAYDGALGSESEGFTIGASAVPNVNTNVILWEAETFD